MKLIEYGICILIAWVVAMILIPIIEAIKDMRWFDGGSDLSVSEEMALEESRRKFAEYEAEEKERKKLKKKGLL